MHVLTSVSVGANYACHFAFMLRIHVINTVSNSSATYGGVFHTHTSHIGIVVAMLATLGIDTP